MYSERYSQYYFASFSEDFRPDNVGISCEYLLQRFYTGNITTVKCELQEEYTGDNPLQFAIRITLSIDGD